MGGYAESYVVTDLNNVAGDTLSTSFYAASISRLTNAGIQLCTLRAGGSCQKDGRRSGYESRVVCPSRVKFLILKV